MRAVSTLSKLTSTRRACHALSVPRASYYRWVGHPRPRHPRTRPSPPRALGAAERKRVLEVLNAPQFADQAPAQVYAMLLDEGEYLCSTSTMYRLLRGEDQVRERRNVLRHPKYKKPELLATGPNQVWTWDITKVKALRKWSYFYLFVMLDIFSRQVMGWMAAHTQNARLAEKFVHETAVKHGIKPGQLTIHADRGQEMVSKLVVQLMSDLGIERSHSRPHCSNDNPYSEAHFRTFKYHPLFPERFGCLQDLISFARPFFDWYNNHHRHSGLGYMTPAAVHDGLAQGIHRKREQTLLKAYAAHPERFVRKPPAPPEVPTEAWINPPDRAPAMAGAP